MTDIISAFNFIRSHGLNHSSRCPLMNSKVNMVTLCTTVKFI